MYGWFVEYLSALDGIVLKLPEARGPSVEIGGASSQFLSDLKMAAEMQRDPEIQHLGKLSLKEEAAGKLRVFAIVDSWTQSLLAPLHKALFSILREIPNDGTFDQDACVNRLRKKIDARSCKNVYSFDLSAATDRLPITLQSQILDTLIGPGVGSA
jgi:hypothetical protein